MDRRRSRSSYKSSFVYSNPSSNKCIINTRNSSFLQLNIKKQPKDYKESHLVKKNTNNIINMIRDKKELNACEYIYKNDKNDVKIIKKLYKVKDCSLFEYGIKESYTKIKYSFCKTCDKNLINPICEACVAKCHKGHRIKQITEKGNIICSCGQHLHKIKCKRDDYKINCFCYEWSYISKLNFYYKNTNNECICYFCYIMCNNNKKNKLIKFQKNTKILNLKNENNDDFPICSCDNDEIHGDVKTLVDNIITFFKNSNQMKKILHPVQIINMIFQSKKCFKYIFFQLKEFISKSKENSKSYFENYFRMDITSTTIYYSFKLIKTLIKKVPFSYYCKEVDNYFSFNIYKLLILSIQKSNVNERSFWIFCRDYTFLFNKLYINKRTKNFIKLKVYDIENLLYFQRIMLLKNKVNNEKEFKESEEIKAFFLSQIRNIDIYQYNSIESIEYLKNILLIFKDFSLCDLLSIDDMMDICIRIEIIFNFLDTTRKSCFKKDIEELIKIEFKLFSLIIKIMLGFIYSYNDKIIYNILNNKEKYPSIQFVTGDRINFLFINNKLGDLINKIVIRIISILVKYYNKKQGLEKYDQILLNSFKILEFSLSISDNYMKNILQSVKYLKDNEFDNSNENNKYYESFLNISNNIEKYYFDYLNFIITEKELLDLMDKSLDGILGESVTNFSIEKDVDRLDIKFTKEKNTAIILTQLIYRINKLFNILYNENKSEEKFFQSEKSETNNLIKKILMFYFIFVNSSPYNSLLVLSSYLITQMTKLPIHYNKIIFKLFNLCFKNFSSNTIQLSNIKYIINTLYHYLQKYLISCTINKIHHDENECLFYYLEIIKIVIYDIKSYHNDNSILLSVKTIIINLIKEFDLFKIYFKNKKKQSLESFDNSNYISLIDIDTINKIFIICIKLINDIFDFSSEKEREIISSVIGIKIVIFALLHFSLDLNERTELIRFARKILIDFCYCEEKEDYYTSFLINKKDNLSYIKNNELINNFNYPTKLLSFVKDFYSLSKYVVLKEKIKRKIKKGKNDKELSILESNNIDECSKILPNRVHNEEPQNINDKGEKICYLNKGTTFTQMCKKHNFYLGIDKNYRFFRDNSIHKKSYSTKMAFFNKNFESSSTKSLIFCSKQKSFFTDETTNELKKIPIFKPVRKRSSIASFITNSSDNKNSKILPYMYKVNENLNYENEYKLRQKHGSFQLKKNFFGKQESKKNNFELKNSILIKNNEFYYYPFFDYDFYRIIKFELDHYFYFTNEIMSNNKNNIKSLKNYFDNGLLIPIIYYFNRVFLFIDKYTGEEVIKIYNLIEKSLNLKIYISKFSFKLWNRENEKSYYENYNESDLIENKKINKKKSYINHIYFTDLKYQKETIQALDELKQKKSFCLDYTYLYKIIEKEFLNMVVNNKNFKIPDSFSEEKKGPNIIIDDQEYYYSLISELIQTEENRIENYYNKTNIEKKLIRIYFLFKFKKSYFLGTIKELSLFNIFNDICFEFHCNYMSLLLMFLIEDYKENDSNLYNIKYYFLYVLLLYMPNETQTNIIELLGGVGTEELGFIIPLFQKLFKKLILSVIDFYNPSDKIDYSNYFIAHNLITIFKVLSSQYNSFFQYHLIKSLSLNYCDKIPERFKIKKIEGSSLNNTINECSDQSISSTENTVKYELIDYVSEDDYSILNPDKTEINFLDFFLCVLLKILLIADKNEKRYELLNKRHLYLYDLFHIILDLLIVVVQGNKTITINNKINYQNSIIMRKKNKSDESITSSINLNLDNDIEIKNSFEIFIDRSLEIIFEMKKDMELLLDIQYKLLLFLISIIEEQKCSKETRNYIVRKIKINKILVTIGRLLKAYYINEEENKDINIVDKNVKIKEKQSKLEKKQIVNFKIHRDINEKMDNNKKNSIIRETFNKTKSFGRLYKKINIDNSKAPLCKTIINVNDKNELINKLNKNHEIEETNEIYKNTLNQNILKSLTITASTQCSFLKSNKNLIILCDDQIVKPEKEFNKKTKELFFDDKLYNYFHKIFYKSNNSQDFTNNILFQLSTLLYKCLKKIAIQEKNKEILKLIKYSKKNKKINNIVNTNAYQNIRDNNDSNELEYENRNIILGKQKTRIIFYNKKEDKTKSGTFNNENEDDSNEINYIEKYYIIKFFESVTSTVEIKIKENLECTKIFTKVPEFRFLSTESKYNFLLEAYKENGKTKKEYLLQNIDYFINELDHYKKRKNSFGYLFSKIPFYYFQKFSYYYLFIFNLFLLFTLEENNHLSGPNTELLRRYNETSVFYFKNKSLSKWGNYYKYSSYYFIIINLALIFLWLCFRFPLYYKLDKLTYIKENKIKKSLKLKNKLYIIFFRIIIRRKYIFILFYVMILSGIAVIFNSVVFIVFGFLPLIQLNKILITLIKIIKERRRELLLVGFLSIILIYILSNFSFFFFKNDYEQYIGQYEDNVCDNLLICFLNAVDYGLRARGGIGDSGKNISFLRNKNHYLGRFFLDIIFFMLIVIIMIDLFFGIITHSFLDIKNEYLQYIDETKRCYICNISDDVLKKYKKYRINIHKEYVHNIWNYVEYIISLKKNGTNFLSYIDAYVIKQLEKKSVAWLPTYTSYIKKVKTEDTGKENSGFEILEETKHQKLKY